MKIINPKISSVILVLLISISPVLSQKDGELPWSYKNTGNNHTILISKDIPISINYVPIDSGDYLGVFFDSLGTLACAGYVMWQNSTTALAAWGEDSGLDGFVTGEKFKWKIWDASLNKEFEAIATFNGEDFFNYDTYVSNGMSGLNSLSGFPEQTIELHEGWNFISSYIKPLESSWDSLLSDIDSSVIIVTDFAGNQYWPQLSANYSQLSFAQSYKIKMNSDASFSIFGYKVNPSDTDIVLNTTIHPIPYLRDREASITALLDTSINNIRLLKNESGQLIWPAMDEFNFGNFYSGKSYQVVSLNTSFFNYPANDSLIDIEDELPEPVLQYYAIDKNTGNNMSLAILQTAWDSLPLINDEIGIFSKDALLVGSAVFRGNNTVITIWGDDKTTNETEGLITASDYTIKLWHHLTGFEDIVVAKEWQEGNSIYVADKISIIKKVKVEQQEAERNYNLQVFNNINSDYLRMFISVPEFTYVEVNLFNSNGRLVKTVVSKYLLEGKHPVDFNYSIFPVGIYFLRMETKKINIVKKVSFL